MSRYTNQLSAEDLIYAIARDYVELSNDKVRMQRDDHMRWCSDWLKCNHARKEINQLLQPMLGSDELVDKWWVSPNLAFDSRTPKEVLAIEPDRVLQYIYGQYSR